MKVNEMSDWEQVGKIKQEQSEENYMNIVVKSLKESIKKREEIDKTEMSITGWKGTTREISCTENRKKEIYESIIPHREYLLKKKHKKRRKNLKKST